MSRGKARVGARVIACSDGVNGWIRTTRHTDVAEKTTRPFPDWKLSSRPFQLNGCFEDPLDHSLKRSLEMAEEPEVQIVGSLNASLAEAMAAKYDKGLEAALRSWIAALLPERTNDVQDTSKSLQVVLKSGEVLCESAFHLRTSPVLRLIFSSSFSNFSLIYYF